MSSGGALLGFASVGVFLGNGLWSLLPTWRSEVSSHESVRVEGPVSDSAIASVECNCHCPPPDNHSLIAGAFIAGCLAAVLLYFVISCWRVQPARIREAEEPRVTRYYSAPSPPSSSPRAIEDFPEPKPRKAAVTPSTRRR